MRALSMYALPVLQKQAKVDFKDSLEQTHIGALVETDLVFPDVDDLHVSLSAPSSVLAGMPFVIP